MLHEWRIDVGTDRPNPNEMTDFNVLTMNGKAMPATEPLVAKLGDRVWIRFGNLSPMRHHPIHLHGYAFKIIGTDGGWAADKSNLLPTSTVTSKHSSFLTLSGADITGTCFFSRSDILSGADCSGMVTLLLSPRAGRAFPAVSTRKSAQ